MIQVWSPDERADTKNLEHISQKKTYEHRPRKSLHVPINILPLAVIPSTWKHINTFNVYSSEVSTYPYTLGSLT